MFWGAGALFSISDSIKFTKEKIYFTMDLFFDCFVVSRSTKPRCFCLSSKPGQLTLCIPSGVTLNHTDCIVPFTAVVEICNHMTIADCAQRLRVRRNPARKEASYLLNQSVLEHPLHASIDTLIT